MRRSKSNQIPITLSESDGIRCLHFGSPWVQGAMRISRPELLVLEYVRRMMGWLLFLEPPERILQLGLGAGSLTRYSLARLPDSRVTVVEV
ncbi:MAG: spermidine synthase, partial [Quisquiliibacterium sp.]